MESIHIKKGLVPFWDEYLVDERHSTAVLSVNKPERVDCNFTFNKPWDEQFSYMSVLKDDDCYRLYISKLIDAYDPVNKEYGDIGAIISYLESKDGIHWEYPLLGICEYAGSKENNIILMGIDSECEDDFVITDVPVRAYDAFSVFKDMNPACPPEERYKGIMRQNTLTPEGFIDPLGGEFTSADRVPLYCLVSFVSADGIHFRKHSIVTKATGFYDSQNTVSWNPYTKRYYCYMRTVHFNPEGMETRFNEGHVRDIAVIESEDFIHWSDVKMLDYMGAADAPMYTNCILPYPYDERYYIGFPTRYNERRSWEEFPNFERLCGREDRYNVYLKSKRSATAMTDCLFMSSRDYYHWRVFDEAIITGGPERLGERWKNWKYGDAYPAWGILETPARVPDAQPEISLLMTEIDSVNEVEVRPAELYKYRLVRYVYRMDGFASYKAPYQPKVLRTKRFTFEGNMLKLNFRTSARGYIRLRILDFRGNPIEGYSTYEIFGDNVERIIDFDKPFGELQGREVCFEFTMSDAEIYAMWFCEE